RRGRDGAERDARRAAVWAVERETRRHAHDRDLHRPPPARLEERGPGARRGGGERHGREELARTARGVSRTEEEPLERKRALTRGTGAGDARVEREQHGHHVRRGGSIRDVAAHRRDVADLVATHHLCALDERAEPLLKGGTPFEC